MIKKTFSVLLAVLVLVPIITISIISTSGTETKTSEVGTDLLDGIYLNADGFIYEVEPGMEYTYTYFLHCNNGEIYDLRASTICDFPTLSGIYSARYPILGYPDIDSSDPIKKLIADHYYTRENGLTVSEQVDYHYYNHDGISFDSYDSVLIELDLYVANDASPGTYHISTLIQSLNGKYKGEYESIISEYRDIIPDALLRRQGELNGLQPVAIESTDYVVNDATYISKSYESMSFTATADQNDNWTYDKFRALYLDGQLVDYNDYYIEKGSLKLTLKYDYPESLSLGDHALKFVFRDGEANAVLHRVDGQYVPPTEPDPHSIPYGTSNMLNFYVGSLQWKGPVKFYVYEVGGNSGILPWGSKKLNGKDNGYGMWSFDPSVLGLVYGKQYGIIFVDSSSGAETYPLLFDTSCIGDTAYLTGSRIEAPYDSNKALLGTRWKNSNYGSIMQITSIGNIVGETCPATTTPYLMMVDYLKNYLSKARESLGKDDQELLDDTAQALSISDDEVGRAIQETQVIVDWQPKQSLPTEPTEPTVDNYGYVIGAYYLTGSINGDNSGTSNVHKALRFQSSTDDQMILNSVSLKEGDVVRVARYNGGNTFTIYPDGVGRDVAISQTGRYDFYFKPYELGNGNYWYITPSILGEFVSYLLGDADGNGDIESVDATFIQRYAANIPTPYTYSQFMHGDVDGDGSLTVMDATAIQYYLCHLKTPYLIGQTIL